MRVGILGSGLMGGKLEFSKLVTMIRDGSNGPENPLCHDPTMDGAGRGKDL